MLFAVEYASAWQVKVSNCGLFIVLFIKHGGLMDSFPVSILYVFVHLSSLRSVASLLISMSQDAVLRSLLAWAQLLASVALSPSARPGDHPRRPLREGWRS